MRSHVRLVYAVPAQASSARDCVNRSREEDVGRRQESPISSGQICDAVWCWIPRKQFLGVQLDMQQPNGRGRGAGGSR